MDKVRKQQTKVKNKVVEIIIGFVITAILGGIWYNTKDYPQVKEKMASDKAEVVKMINDFMTDQAENNKMYNGMLYNLNEWKKRKQIIDSLNSKH